jgi:hypothetical protein
MTPFENQLRLTIFQRIIDGESIKVVDIASALAISTAEVEASFQRLADEHVLVLKPGSFEIWMAMPFSAVPTEFQVFIGQQRWWANCIWDALGIAPMLKRAARIETKCPDCGERLTLDVEPDRLITKSGIIHFAVPAKDWWLDIGYT